MKEYVSPRNKTPEQIVIDQIRSITQALYRQPFFHGFVKLAESKSGKNEVIQIYKTLKEAEAQVPYYDAAAGKTGTYVAEWGNTGYRYNKLATDEELAHGIGINNKTEDGIRGDVYHSNFRDAG